MYVYVKVIKRMLVEEILDGTEQTKKRLSCATSATTETDEINKKNRHHRSLLTPTNLLK
jgi:hypothetical protein